MKIFDAAALSLNAGPPVNVQAIDINRYSATIMIDETKEIEFTADIAEFSITLSTQKKSLPDKKYRKFLPLFEYNLEQKFFKNIVLNTEETVKDYKIKISF